MGNTKIEWAEKVWNPVTGCTHIGTPGCDNCYARRMSKRLVGRCGYPKDNPFKVTLHPHRLEDPLHWKKPRRIFVCSMGDLFHDKVWFNFQYKVFEMMLYSPQHTFLILTKRPKNAFKSIKTIYFHLRRNHNRHGLNYQFPLPNIWLGVSAENQETFNERVRILLSIPAKVHFVSIEPMLGEIDLCVPYGQGVGDLLIDNLNWEIVGAESGPNRRICALEWIRNIIIQCKEASVPVFVKQIHHAVTGKLIKDADHFIMVREYPE